MFQKIKCLFLSHKWIKDKSGFDPLTGNFYIAWLCERCKKLRVQRCKKDEEIEELRL
jgi:hypothetical protein